MRLGMVICAFSLALKFGVLRNSTVTAVLVVACMFVAAAQDARELCRKDHQ